MEAAMLALLEAPSVYGSSLDVRRCSRCGELKPTTEFQIKNKATGLRRTWCRPCCRAYGKEHYRRARPQYIARARTRRRTGRPQVTALVDEYLRSHPCVDCGTTDLKALDFVHR